MQYRPLGSSGIMVSRLCYGTMSFGGRADKVESERLYRYARERGINFFDSANVYQKGESERYLGSFIKDERSKVVITTKAHSPMSDDPNDRGSSAKNLTESLHASLKRLGTDYIDLFILHGYDPHTRAEEILKPVEKFILQGKILSFGVSNYAAWQTQRLFSLAEREALPLVQAVQPMYNLTKRTAEIEILPMAKANQIAAMTYSPLAGGLLVGRHSKDSAVPSVRIQENPAYLRRYGGAFYADAASAFLTLATELDLHPATLAVSWTLAHEAVTASILGAATVEQLTPSIDAIDVALNDEILASLDAISPPPPPPTDRTE